MKPVHGLLLATLLSLTALARADVLVLVHGWRADADTWWQSGVMPVLHDAGWRDAGVVAASPGGMVMGPPMAHDKQVYRAQLPAAAPLAIQAGHLFAELQAVRQRHPEEPLTLVGHSAGGLVGRMVLVAPQAPSVDGFVSIAAPNLGTPRAIQGLDVADGKPFFCPGPGIDFLKSLFGGHDYDYLKASRGALVDLVPGNLTHWLNSQPHPDIRYTSIIHVHPGQGGDELVPAFSQDLNQVPALRGRAKVYQVPAPHGLSPGDGHLLLDSLTTD